MNEMRQVRQLAALADPSRFRIIQLLGRGPLTVGKVAEAINLPFVNISHHLGVLRQAGVVQHTKQGRFVVYQLHPDVFTPAKRTGGPAVLDLSGIKVEMAI
jgi:DNA-binding transcriptional ArsR family regulator